MKALVLGLFLLSACSDDKPKVIEEVPTNKEFSKKCKDTIKLLNITFIKVYYDKFTKSFRCVAEEGEGDDVEVYRFFEHQLDNINKALKEIKRKELF